MEAQRGSRSRSPHGGAPRSADLNGRAGGAPPFSIRTAGSLLSRLASVSVGLHRRC